jgi:cytochrome d ubiquinol oxidase subunit I
VFAAAGIAMPLLMVIAEGRWLRTRDPVDLELTRRWARGTAILFAVGAVSGTVLSFELGLLWPRFMRHAGAIVGMPFALEGFAFFLEAIFLGIYLYGWDRVPPRVHWLAGVVIAASGALSGIFVVTANAWMNTPAGFRMVNGEPVDIDPIAAMLNPAAFQQTLHMTIAAYLAVSAAAAGIHAFALRREPTSVFHRRAFSIVFPVMVVSALLQPISGDISARQVARSQPIKLAAMEGQFETERRAPLRIGGIPDETAEVTRHAIEIPGGLSFLAFHDVNAEVRGLKSVPRADRPPVAVVHLAFQAMIACGMALLGTGLLGVFLQWRRRGQPLPRWFLGLVVVVAPLGLVAIEAGWTVTEVGRQPWIIYGVMRTKDAVTPMPGLIVPFLTISALYLFLAVIVLHLLRRQVFASMRGGAPVPDDPAGSPDAVR